MFTIVLASHNQHKKEEISQILSPYNINVLSLKDVGVEQINIKENGKNFKENALIKANAYSKLTTYPILSDDSGLQIKSMNNRPGIRSARYAKECGSYLNAFKDIFNNIKGKDRSAKFVCVLSLLNFKEEPLFFKGECKGKIIKEIPNDIDENSFGYDPIFLPDGYDKTFANLSHFKKNRISHRYKALEKLIDYLKKEKNIL